MGWFYMNPLGDKQSLYPAGLLVQKFSGRTGVLWLNLETIGQPAYPVSSTRFLTILL
jgi:hypothetical protein